MYVLVLYVYICSGLCTSTCVSNQCIHLYVASIFVHHGEICWQATDTRSLSMQRYSDINSLPGIPIGATVRIQAWRRMLCVWQTLCMLCGQSAAGVCDVNLILQFVLSCHFTMCSVIYTCCMCSCIRRAVYSGSESLLHSSYSMYVYCMSSWTSASWALQIRVLQLRRGLIETQTGPMNIVSEGYRMSCAVCTSCHSAIVYGY